MNILYLCNVMRSVPAESGVLKKVYAQCNVMRDAGHSVVLACLDDATKYVFADEADNVIHSISIANVNKFNKNRFVLNQVYKFIKEHNIQFVYSRFSDYSLDAHYFYRSLKRMEVKVVLEIPTYPISQRWTSIRQSLKSGKIKTAITQIYNSTLGSLGILLFKKSIDRIVNNNNYDIIWGIPVIKITNGIDVKSIPNRAHEYKNKKSLTIFSVANVANWHGYDRIISGLGEYYKNQPAIEVTFELVGPGIEVELLKEQVASLKLTEYVKFWGTVAGSDLNTLYERADIGVSVLGVHRNHFEYYDALKSREFCARKLPFITEVSERHFNKKSFALCVPSDDSPIDIDSVVDFYNEIVDNSIILDDMYEFAKQECDWSIAFKNVIIYINSLNQ